MKPFSSSSEKENCSPVSSNCVEWQGPFITCINHCKGDSVSDIVYKLSQEVCDIQGGASVGNINVTCLLNACTTLQAPNGTLGSLLQTIVDSICCSVGTLTTTTNTLTQNTANLYKEPILTLPTNFQYVDPATGLPVTQLPLSGYAANIGTNASLIKTIVDRQTSQISNQEIRIQNLENSPGYVPPTVTPLCSYTGITSGLPTQMNLLLTAVENDHCNYRTALGTISNISNASNAQCAFLGSSAALGQSGTMSSISGWNNTVSNFAQSMQNLWLTVCDMRTAVNTIKQNITPDCSKFLLGFTNTANTGRTTVTLIFNSLTVIPSGFTNCPTLSTVSITDGAHTYTTTLNLTTVGIDPAGITYTVSGAGLDPLLPYTITVNGCLVSNGTTCSKTVSNTNAPTTTTTTSTTTTSTTTTTTTTTPTPHVYYNIGGGISGNLSVTRISDSVVVLTQDSSSTVLTGQINVTNAQYRIRGTWLSGSGNIVNFRVCDMTTGTELFYSTTPATASNSTVDYLFTFTSGTPNIMVFLRAQNASVPVCTAP